MEQESQSNAPAAGTRIGGYGIYNPKPVLVPRDIFDASPVVKPHPYNY